MPSTYGTDNRCMLDGLACSLGAAVIHGNISNTVLSKLHNAGVRGIRFNRS